MNKRIFLIPLLLASVSLITISVFGSTFASWVVTDKADSFGMQIGVAQESYTVTFYTTYDGTWGGTSQVSVNYNETVDTGDIPVPSVTGYTFNGWRTTVPSLTNYTVTVTSQQVDNAAVTNNMTYYPIFISDDIYVETIEDDVTRLIKTDTDCTISHQIIGATKVGYKYYGVEDGLPVSTQKFNTYDLITASGVYKFHYENDSLSVLRKIGFKPNSTWNISGKAFGMYSWKDSANLSWHFSVINNVSYAYTQAYFINFKFSRYGSSEQGFVWGDESGNLSFDQEWWYNGSNSNKYTSSTIILSMNNGADTGWGPGDCTWVAS